MVDDAVARIIAVAIRLTQHGSDQARVFLPADEARYLTVRGDASRRNLRYDGENLVNQIFVQDFSHRIAPVFAFAFGGRGADHPCCDFRSSPYRSIEGKRVRVKVVWSSCWLDTSTVRLKCDLSLLEKDAEDVFGDGGAADDSHEFALVINHRKLLELLLCQ